MNWDDPSARYHLIERVGVEEYNRLHAEQMERETVERVNGHRIRKIGSRFGTIYMVSGTNKGHSTLEGARKIAMEAEG